MFLLFVFAVLTLLVLLVIFVVKTGDFFLGGFTDLVNRFFQGDFSVSFSSREIAFIILFVFGFVFCIRCLNRFKRW